MGESTPLKYCNFQKGIFKAKIIEYSTHKKVVINDSRKPRFINERNDISLGQKDLEQISEIIQEINDLDIQWRQNVEDYHQLKNYPKKGGFKITRKGKTYNTITHQRKWKKFQDENVRIQHQSTYRERENPNPRSTTTIIQKGKNINARVSIRDIYRKDFQLFLEMISNELNKSE